MSNEVENNTTEQDAVSNLMALLDEEETQNAEMQEENTKESDVKDEWQNYKAQQEDRINALKAEIEALKSAKEQEVKQGKEELEKTQQKEELLKELGLSGLGEKLARLDKFDEEQKQREEQAQMANRFNDLENELKKSYPNADFKALGELGGKLMGLDSGDKEAWQTLAHLVYKTSLSKADENLSSSNANVNTSDTATKLNKGESVDDIEIGKYLLSLEES